jgi:hypothetical protein
MSSIILLAPFLALLVSLALLAAIRFFSRHRNGNSYSNRLGCAIAGLAFPTITIVLFIALPPATTTTGIGVVPQEANQHLLTFSVPVAASDINFRHSFFAGTIDEADFAISEEDFLNWAGANHWSPKALHVADEPSELPFSIVVRPLGPGVDEYEPRNGYYVFVAGPRGDAGLCVVFDKDQGRAFIYRTRF